MRKIIILLCCFMLLSCIELKKTPNRWYSIEQQQKKFKLNEVKSYKDVYNITQKPTIYRLDSVILDNLIKTNPKKYLAFYTFNCWIENFQDSLLNKIIKQYDNDTISLFLLSTDDWTQKKNTLKYLENLDNKHNIFMLDITQYGISLNPNTKILNFLHQLNKEDTTTIGFHRLILFSNNKSYIMQ